MLVTHDLGVVSAVADDVVVMYAGRVVEFGPAAEVLARPRHPYTQGLLQCVPRMRDSEATRSGGGDPNADGPHAAPHVVPRAALHVVPGSVPDPAAMPTGCPFHPRCKVGAGEARCREEDQPMRAVSHASGVACWKAEIG